MVMFIFTWRNCWKCATLGKCAQRQWWLPSWLFHPWKCTPPSNYSSDFKSGEGSGKDGVLRLSEEGLERRTSEGIGSSGQAETKSQAQVCELYNEDLGRGHQQLRVEFETQQGFPLSLQLKSEVVLNAMGLKRRWRKHVIPIRDTSLRNSSKEKI